MKYINGVNELAKLMIQWYYSMAWNIEKMIVMITSNEEAAWW